MHGILSRCLALLAVAGTCLMASPGAAQTEKRVALVIGNAAYPQGALPTTANDAGLIAQTLQAAGFDVVGARDLDGDTLRHALHDFMQKVSTSGPDTVAMVYLAGYGLQLGGENYFLPVDAKIANDSDLPVEGVRIGDYIHQLATMPLRAGIFVVDAARQNPFTLSGHPLAGGLALVEPDPKMLIAYNAAPGTVGPSEPGPYGAYAQALAETIREGGLRLPDLFDRVRLRVNELTKGALVPWNAQRVQSDFVFFERSADAPQAAPPAEVAAAQTRPIRDFDARDAYAAALERDTLEGYDEFLATFPRDPMAPRVRALIAARREAITWRRTYRADTPNAYWSYLRRYPEGPHAWDARRRLAELAAALEPPPDFAVIDYDVPPPPPDEIVYVDRPVIVFDDPIYAFVAPPPPPIFFLPPPDPAFVLLPPPPPPVAVFVLPTPMFVVMPTYVQPPAYVAPPPNNIIFANIHNTTVINNVINKPVAAAAVGAPAGSLPPAGAARPGGASVVPVVATATPALPPSVQRKATIIQQQGLKGPPGGTAQGQRLPGQPPQANLQQPNKLQPLPGAGGQPLPKSNLLPVRPGPAQTNHAPALTNIHPNALPPKPSGPVPHNGATVSLPPKPNATVTTPPGPHGTIQHAPPPQIANRPPPHVTPNVALHAPPPPAAHRPPPPPAVVHRPPPPPVIANRPPPPAVVNRPPPPPAVVHRPPPPPVIANRPPPPPAVVNRPPPPPPVVNRAPPHPVVVNRPPPPPVANHAPSASAAKKCVVENGKQVCR